MIRAENTQKIINDNSSTINPEAGKPIFCCGIAPSGTIVRHYTQPSIEMLAAVKDCYVAWIDIPISDFMNQAVSYAAIMGFDSSMITALLSSNFTGYEDRNSELGLILPAVKIGKFDVESFPLMILMRKNLVVTMHSIEITRLEEVARYAATFMRKIKADLPIEDKVSLVLIRIIDHNNARNFEKLRFLEQQGDELNRLLMDPQTPRTRLGPEIYQMKHGLISYLNTMWATKGVLSALRYGDAEVISDDDTLLGRIEVLSQHVEGQIGLAEHLSEVLASGLEVLQSIYNNQLQILNNRMALVMTFLTIIGTAVLVPNTIATIMSNSAFAMTRRDIWWYIPLLAVSTALSTWLAWWWVKSRGWLPKKID